MLLLNERNKLCKGLFIINNLRPSSRDLVLKCCIGRAPKESGKCCEVAVRRDEEGCFVKVNLEIATDNLISQTLNSHSDWRPQRSLQWEGGQRFQWWHQEASWLIQFPWLILSLFWAELWLCPLNSVGTWRDAWRRAACSDDYGAWRCLRMPTSWMDSATLALGKRWLDGFSKPWLLGRDGWCHSWAWFLLRWTLRAATMMERSESSWTTLDWKR